VRSKATMRTPTKKTRVRMMTVTNKKALTTTPAPTMTTETRSG
jgi:hypothetical protein